MTTLSSSEIPGLVMKPPLLTPQPGQQIVGYERFRHDAACCNCDGMTSGGVIAIILLVLFFWPLAFLPCIMDDCREEFQRPVYAFPGQAPVPVVAYQPPVGVPVAP